MVLHIKRYTVLLVPENSSNNRGGQGVLSSEPCAKQQQQALIGRCELQRRKPQADAHSSIAAAAS